MATHIFQLGGIVERVGKVMCLEIKVLTKAVFSEQLCSSVVKT